MAILILLQSFTVFANPNMTDQEIIDSSKWATVNKLTSLQNSLDNKATNQYGLLYNLNYLVQYLGYLEFMMDVEILGFTEAEKELYLEDAKRIIENFNKRFSSDGTDIGTIYDNEGNQLEDGSGFYIEPLPLTLTEPSSIASSDVKMAIQNIIEQDVPGYGELYLQYVKEKMIEISGVDEVTSKDYSPVRREISVLNKILVFTSGHISHLTSMLPSEYKEDLGKLSNYSAFKERVVGTDLEEILNDAKDLTTDIKDIIGNVEYKDAMTYVEQLANVQLITGSDSSVYGPGLWSPLNNDGSGFRLSEMYLAMVASSAVYRPMESKVGEEAFMQSLISLVGSENEAKVRRLYSEVKEYRKPLFVVEKKKLISTDDNEFEGSGRTKYSGDARKVTLKELQEMAISNDSFGFITVKGDLKENPNDGNSYTYFLEGGSQRYEGGTTQSPNTEDININEEPTGEDEIFIEDEWEDGDDVGDTDGASLNWFNKFIKPVDVYANPEDDEAEDGDSIEDDGFDEPNIKKDTEAIGTDLAGRVMVPDGDTVSTIHWTDIVFEVGKHSSSGTINRMLLANVLQSVRNKKEMKKWENSFLYINTFGDITLSDGTVVIPGAANATLYSDVYNPYTVAFYNNYPQINPYSKKIDFYQPEEAVKGKYVMREVSGSRVRTNTGLPTDVLTTPIRMFQIQGTHNLKIFGSFNGMSMIAKFYNEGQDLMPTFLKSSLKQSGIQEGVSNLKGSGPYLIPQPVTFQDIPILPYDDNIDEGSTGAQMIGRNMLWSYIATESGNSNVGNGVLRENFIFENLILEGLGGTPYASTYQKITGVSNQIEKPYGFVVSWITDWTRSMLEKSNTDGILGMKTRYEIPIFGKIYRAFSDYAAYIITVLFVLFVISYLKKSYSLVAVGMYTMFSAALVYIFLSIVPVYIPIVYNSIVNDFGRKTGYDIVLTGSEVYEKSYGQATEKDKSGRYLNRLGSINLYRMNNADMDMVANNLSVNKRDFMGGDVYEIDSVNSIYIEGDYIKTNLDTLFANNPVRGMYRETEDGIMYQLKGYKETSSMIDYYMPYYLIQDGFIETLNGFLRSYRIPRMTVKYLEGLSKDSFLVYNYANSLPFLSGDDLYADKTMEPDQESILQENVGDFNDFLGIRNILENPTDEFRETLWWRNMVKLGMFDVGSEAEAKREDLIYYVNYHTKKFIIDLGPEVGMASDENLIKLISLQATTLFNQRISSGRNWVYPTSLNFAEFQLEDVMRVSLSNNEMKFYENDLDIVSYVYDNKGLTGSIGLLVVIALLQALALVLPIVIHGLYLSLLVLLLWRFITEKDIQATMKGYAKSNLVFFGLFTIFTVSAANVSSILMLSIIMTLLVFFLYIVVSNILLNFGTLGNDSLTASFNNLAAKLSTANFRNSRIVTKKEKVSRSQEEVMIEMMMDDPKYYNRYMNQRRMEESMNRNKRRNRNSSFRNKTSNVDLDYMDSYGLYDEDDY